MLVLTRKHGESVRIGSDVRVTIVTSKGGQVRIAIEAPTEVGIYREEIFERVASANVEAASNSTRLVSGLVPVNGLQMIEPGGNGNE